MAEHFPGVLDTPRRSCSGLLIGFAAGAGLLAAVTTVAVGTRRPRRPELSGSARRRRGTFAGRRRKWVEYRPAGLPSGRSADVLVVLHGSGDTGRRIRADIGYGFDRLADQHGFVVLYPDGYRRNWNEIRVGGDFAAKRRGIDDVSFLVDLASDTSGQGAVWVTGYSSGGQMAIRVAVDAGDRVAAIVPVAANVPTPDNLRVTDDRRSPVAVLLVAGVADPVNPYAGGEVSLHGLGRRGAVLSAATGARWFADRNGGRATPPFPLAAPMPSEQGFVSRERYTPSGVPPVELLTLQCGHHYPAPGFRGPRIFGLSTDFDVPAAAVDFARRATAARRADSPGA